MTSQTLIDLIIDRAGQILGKPRLPLPTETPVLLTRTSAGVQSGDSSLRWGGVAVLDSCVEWNKYCEVCDRIQLSVASLCCARGLIAVCVGCGNERVAAWTRVNSEGE